jgi:ribosomal protein S18 acetylase RimI-like enzyme
MEVRRVRDDECDALGRMVLDAYQQVEGVVLDPDYAAELRDVAGRARRAVVLVAVDDDGSLLGCVTYVPHRGAAYAEHDVEGAASIRMLAVAPTSQGKGVGEALARACIERARAAGCVELVLHSTVWMLAAHRLYDRLGFLRAPELDWEPDPAVQLLGYRLPLTG